MELVPIGMTQSPVKRLALEKRLAHTEEKVTKFLVSDKNPKGRKLEDVLKVIRKDILIRCKKVIDDPKPEAEQVIANNMEILNLLTQAIARAEDSTDILTKAFGPQGKKPRIGSK